MDTMLWRIYQRARLESVHLSNGVSSVEYAEKVCTLLRPSTYIWEAAMPGATFTMQPVGDAIHIHATCGDKATIAYITHTMMLDASNGYDGAYVGLMDRCRDWIAPRLAFRKTRAASVTYEHAA